MFRSLLIPGLVIGVVGALGLQGCSDTESGKTEAPRPALVVQPLTAGASQDVFPGEVRAR